MDSDEIVELHDGSRVIVRPVELEDRERFVRGFERFGPQSRYRRFLGFKKRLSESELAFFTEVDHHDHEALGALEADTGDGVGVARYVRLHSSTAAEASVAVIDAWHGRGVGGVLLGRLAERARAEGVERFVATVLAENRAMLRVFERLGPVTVRHRSEVLELEVELPGRAAPTAGPDAPRARA
jgi:GNAT superfamily N-acetyltransferase